MMIKMNHAALLRWITIGCLSMLSLRSGFAQELPSNAVAQVEAAPAAELVVEAPQGSQQTRELVAAIRAQIVDAESTQDSFSSNIGELSYELGSELLHLGLYDEALESFRRSEHLLRINSGLYALEQVPALEGMIEAHMGLRDWEAVNEDMDKLIWLYRRNRSADESPEYLSVLYDFAKYHMAAYYGDVDKLGLLHLVQAQDTLAFIADNSLERGFPYDPLLYESLSVANYELMGYSAGGAAYADIPELSRRGGLGLYLSNSYRRGLDYLNTGRDVAYQSNNLQDQIRANLMLSDWYQMFRKRYEAQDYLLQAWSLAKQIDQQNSADFTQPHLLPRQDFISLLPSLTPIEDRHKVLVRLDVDQWGSPRNVELASPIEGDDLADQKTAGMRAVRNARQSRFRPAIVDGESVEYIGYVQSVFVEDR
jgi:hypothetical protein